MWSVFFKNHQSQSKYYCFSPGFKSNVECGPCIAIRTNVYDLLNFYINNRTGAIATLAPLSGELTKPAGRPADFASAGRRGASAGHRLCEFKKSWHRPGGVRRADARTTSAGGIKYV